MMTLTQISSVTLVRSDTKKLNLKVDSGLFRFHEETWQQEELGVMRGVLTMVSMQGYLASRSTLSWRSIHQPPPSLPPSPSVNPNYQPTPTFPVTTRLPSGPPQACQPVHCPSAYPCQRLVFIRPGFQPNQGFKCPARLRLSVTQCPSCPCHPTWVPVLSQGSSFPLALRARTIYLAGGHENTIIIAIASEKTSWVKDMVEQDKPSRYKYREKWRSLLRPHNRIGLTKKKIAFDKEE